MKDQPLDELDPALRPSVEAWRTGEVDPEGMSAALGRIVAHPPHGRQRRWALIPALAAAGLLGLLLYWVPAAWAEVASGAGGLGVEPAGPDLPALKAAWRPLVIAHVSSLLVAYPLFLASWVLSHVGVAARWAGSSRLRRTTGRLAPWLAGAGAASWFVGVVLGAVWARRILGRYWDWDPKEIMGLATLATAVVWTAVAWKWRGGVLSAAVAAVGLWLILDLCLGYLGGMLGRGHSYGYAVLPRVLLTMVLLDLVGLLGVWVWLRGEGVSQPG
jgi:hypothetical protein